MITTTYYTHNDDIIIVEVSVNGKTIGVCAEDQVENLVAAVK